MQPSGADAYSPIHPEYRSERMRLETFLEWPENKTQTRLQMAKAGFYLTAKPDYTRCFYCSGSLHRWLPGDDPWVEHARWFPKCLHVIQQRGEAFIRLIQNGREREAPRFEEPPRSEDFVVQSHTAASSYDEDEDVLAMMQTPVVEMVLAMEFNRESVQRVLAERLRSGGKMFEDVEELVQKLIPEDTVHNSELNVQQRPQAATSSSSLPRGTIRHFDATVTSLTESASLQSAAEPHGYVNMREIEGRIDLLNKEKDEMLAANMRLLDERACKICMDQEANILFLNCGHLATCANCAAAVTICPICRSHISGTVRVYNT